MSTGCTGVLTGFIFLFGANPTQVGSVPKMERADDEIRTRDAGVEAQCLRPLGDIRIMCGSPTHWGLPHKKTQAGCSRFAACADRGHTGCYRSNRVHHLQTVASYSCMVTGLEFRSSNHEVCTHDRSRTCNLLDLNQTPLPIGLHGHT